jgi:hypothetical protein
VCARTTPCRGVRLGGGTGGERRVEARGGGLPSKEEEVVEDGRWRKGGRGAGANRVTLKGIIEKFCIFH